jgi:translocator protein
VQRRASSTPCRAIGARSSSRSTSTAVDWAALVRYVAATALQLGLMVATMLALDRFLLPRLPLEAQIPLVAFWFLGNSFFSRKFSVLDNSRPTLDSERAAISSRLRPSWMPPPLVFPIVWSSIGLLRCAASTMIWGQTGVLAAPALILFMAHLAIGDTWNNINNKEQRLGVASIGVMFVLGSAAATVSAYYRTLPLAGYVLSPLVVWLCIATALVWDIWRINGGAAAYPLYPTVGSSKA